MPYDADPGLSTQDTVYPQATVLIVNHGWEDYHSMIIRLGALFFGAMRWIVIITSPQHFVRCGGRVPVPGSAQGSHCQPKGRWVPCACHVLHLFSFGVETRYQAIQRPRAERKVKGASQGHKGGQTKSAPTRTCRADCPFPWSLPARPLALGDPSG